MNEHFLNAQTTSFIGRQSERKEIEALIFGQKSRLITLVGPGGIGKTRLAIEAARQAHEHFQGDSYLIDLNPVQTREQILLAIKETLHLERKQAIDSLSQVVEQIKHRHLLLIFDNFESVIDEALLLAEMLRAAPKIKILTTSREPLNLQEEWLIRINGLPYPEKDTISQEEIKQYGAVQLFLERAHQSGSPITDPSDLACAARICRMVDGAPLAIELGAGLLRSMTCGEVADQLEYNIDVLSTSIRNIPRRHRSMRAVFEESWHLMAEKERESFLALSVFNGRFQRQIAQEITGAKPQDLSSLVEKSLLQHTSDETYRFHDLMTQFASEKLGKTPQKQTELIEKFCIFYGEFVKSREADIKSGRQREALDEIEQEFNHIRTAWQRAVVNRNYDVVGEMLVGLNHFCFIRGHVLVYQEMIRLGIKYLAPAPGEEPHVVWGKILSRQDFSTNNEEKTLKEVEISLQIAMREEDTADIARCLFALGRIATNRRDDKNALEHYQRSLKKYHELGDPFYLAFIHSIIGRLFLDQGKFDESIGYLNQSLVINQQIGNLEGEAYCLDNLAAAQFNKGAFSESQENHLQANRLYTQLHHRPAMAYSGIKVGVLAMFNGNFPEARTFLESAVVLSLEIKYHDLHSFALAGLGVLDCLENENYEQALKLFEKNPSVEANSEHLLISAWGRSLANCGLQDMHAAQHALRESLKLALASHNLPLVLFCLPVAAAIQAHQGEKMTAIELMALSYEHPLSVNGWKEASPLISRFLASLKRTIPANVFQQAWEKGKRKGIDEIITVCQAITDTPISEMPASMPNAIPGHTGTTSGQNLTEPLSDRELEVLQLLIDGYSNRQIAKELFIALGTTKAHIHNIYSKLDVKSRSQAIRKARALSLP